MALDIWVAHSLVWIMILHTLSALLSTPRLPQARWADRWFVAKTFTLLCCCNTFLSIDSQNTWQVTLGRLEQRGFFSFFTLPFHIPTIISSVVWTVKSGRQTLKVPFTNLSGVYNLGIVQKEDGNFFSNVCHSTTKCTGVFPGLETRSWARTI